MQGRTDCGYSGIEGRVITFPSGYGREEEGRKRFAFDLHTGSPAGAGGGGEGEEEEGGSNFNGILGLR